MFYYIKECKKIFIQLSYARITASKTDLTTTIKSFHKFEIEASFYEDNLMTYMIIYNIIIT